MLRKMNGLTIVEILAAAILAMLISLSLLRADLTSRQAMRVSRVQLEAASALQTYMEQMRSQAYVSIADATYNGITVSDAGTNDTADDITGDVVVDVTDNGDDTKTIDGTITWNERFMNQTITRTLSLSTLVSEP